jgi:phospholipid-transporting ATPase
MLAEQLLPEAKVERQREMKVLDPQANSASNFATNSVSTSKYSFIPLSIHFIVWKNLFEQFHKAANLYFLLISALQLIPGISPTGQFTTLIPLTAVLLVTMAKDTYEDVKRHRSDAEVNGRATMVWRGGEWTRTAWRDVKVGEVIRVSSNEPFPADLILVWSPNPEGMCYIETANLDGETNLKIRKAVGGIYKIFTMANPDVLSGQITCEAPNNRLYNFDGVYEKMGKLKVSLSVDNVLLRGANLRNTKEAVGIVVFTGPETKLMKNSAAKASKMSRIDHVTNRQILFVFVLLLLACTACTMGITVLHATGDSFWYLPTQGEDAIGIVIAGGFATFLILFNNLIPISLYVTMETVKLVLAGYINNDIAMYHHETDTPAVARTSSLCEELGQVDYIFSDKTGTLTCNMMDFLKFTCQKYDPFQKREIVVSYGTGTTEIGRAAAAREGRVLQDDRPASWQPRDGQYFYDTRIHEGAWTKQPNAEALEFFFVFLAVCHAVVPEMEHGKLVYQAASPDEGCLVKAAKFFGVTFLERTDSSVTIDVNGDVQKWDILNIIEFDSTRKRMSVICMDPKGKLMLLCKGADTVIYERLKHDPRGDEVRSETQTLLTQFAAEGLRTLVLGKLDLDPPTYHKWAKKYNDATCAIQNRAQKMADVAEEIEHDLDLVGTTAIEDKLQEGVPQTIELLSTAGIKIWVLTGDKQETAINIGFACALLHNDMGLFMFDECTKDNIHTKLSLYLTDAKAVVDVKSDVDKQDLGLVIQGDILEEILPKETEKDKPEAQVFLALASRCRSVICCRVSPLQKAQVVKLVRDNIDTVTLAIGDGANDVSMIQAAHVGIGISGLEGLQAARASDYSISQFRFLQRLLLVHGRYSYRRISKVILYCFYKNVALFLTQLWFAAFNRVTGQSLYDQWALSGYNMAFTAAPIIAMAIFDKDVEPEVVLSKDMFPELYHDGMKNLIFNTMSFWMYTFNAVAHSLTCFFICMFATDMLTTADGQSLGLNGTGITCYTAVLFTVTAKIAFEAHVWTVANVVIIFGSLGAWFFFLGVYGVLYGTSKVSSFAAWYGLPVLAFGQPVFWLIVILCVILCMLRELAWKCWRHNFSQKLVHIVQEFNAQGKRFSRRDVARCSPHLLPKFDALKPYNIDGKVADAGESEMSVAALLGVGLSSPRRRVTAGVERDSTHQGDAKDSSRDRPPTGAFFAQPGKVNIRSIILDDL